MSDEFENGYQTGRADAEAVFVDRIRSLESRLEKAHKTITTLQEANESVSVQLQQARLELEKEPNGWVGYE